MTTGLVGNLSAIFTGNWAARIEKAPVPPSERPAISPTSARRTTSVGQWPRGCRSCGAGETLPAARLLSVGRTAPARAGRTHLSPVPSRPPHLRVIDSTTQQRPAHRTSGRRRSRRGPRSRTRGRRSWLGPSGVPDPHTRPHCRLPLNADSDRRDERPRAGAARAPASRRRAPSRAGLRGGRVSPPSSPWWPSYGMRTP